LSLDIKEEAKSQDFLDTLRFDFDSSGNLIKGGMKRISGMLSTGKSDRKLMFYMIIGIVVSFFIIYKLFNHLRT
jgi:blocked early in transport 1